MMASKRRNVVVSTLVAAFGMCSWIAVNALWIELPLLVLRLPEGWNLPSFLSILVQLGNIGPCAFLLLRKVFPNQKQEPLVYSIMLLGILSMCATAFLWHHTSVIGGSSHSVSLFFLTFLLSLVNCSSNVVSLPYMSKFKPIYVTAYFIGMGLSGLVPSVIGLIQGVSETTCIEVNVTANETKYFPQQVPPLFGVEAYFGIIVAAMSVSLLSFLLLQVLPIAQSERSFDEKLGGSNGQRSDDDIVARMNAATLDDSDEKLNKNAAKSGSINALHEVAGCLSMYQVLFYLLITGWVCALVDTILPSIQSFAALPYGNTTYHLVITLSAISNLIGCFTTFFIQVKRALSVAVLATVATAGAAFVILLAAQSPEPMLVGTTFGDVVAISAPVVVSGITAYVRTATAEILRVDGGEKYLKWCGISTQVGSFAGAVVVFPLVNVYQLFKSANACG